MGSLVHPSNMLNIAATDDTLNVFNDMKLKHKIGYIVFKVDKKPDNHKQQCICVESQGVKAEIGDDWRETFVEAVKESGSCRYGVIDWNNKLLFVSWVPDTAKAKDKMVYASIKEAFIDSLVGIQIKIQCTDDSELSLDMIAEQTKSNV